jgi:hypothetical protein
VIALPTYNDIKLTRVPIEEGISPVNSFDVSHLEIKSDNKSVIICHKILIVKFSTTYMVSVVMEKFLSKSTISSFVWGSSVCVSERNAKIFNIFCKYVLIKKRN